MPEGLFVKNQCLTLVDILLILFQITSLHYIVSISRCLSIFDFILVLHHILSTLSFKFPAVPQPPRLTIQLWCHDSLNLDT